MGIPNFLIVLSFFISFTSATLSVWSMGIPNFPFSGAEAEIYNHTLKSGSVVGVVNHFWSCACGGRAIDWRTEGGIAIYRLYIDGEETASLQFTPREMIGLGVFDPAGGSNDRVSLQEPYHTELLGKLSDWDGFFFKMKIPFYKSIRLTAQLPAGVAGFNVYTIIRGTEDDTPDANFLNLAGFGPLPFGTRLVQSRNDGVVVKNLGFIPIVNLTGGQGLIYSHTISIQGNPGFTYLEGCFHLITPIGANAEFDNVTGVAPGFPGAVLSTGTEDYYSSSFYFHAGLFAARDTGVTHMCGLRNTVAPKCLGNNSGFSQWSAYRFHDSDPLPFSGGAQLLMRNGDKADSTPYGLGKCYNLDMKPDGMSPVSLSPSHSFVISLKCNRGTRYIHTREHFLHFSRGLRRYPPWLGFTCSPSPQQAHENEKTRPPPLYK